MERNDYKSKYLKYKQKYINTLENMYGGVVNLNETIIDAFDKKPKAVYIVDEETYNNVRTLLSLRDNETTKNINKYTDCIDMLIGISNRNVLKIIPMAKIYGFENDKYPDHPFNGYTNALQKIDGSKAAYNKIKLPFTKYKNSPGLLYFGEDEKNLSYSSETVKNHLKLAKEYFTSCSLAVPYIIILQDNILSFYGKLYVEIT